MRSVRADPVHLQRNRIIQLSETMSRMKTTLFVVTVVMVTVVKETVSEMDGDFPRDVCLCVNKRANVHSSACGMGAVLGSLNNGTCFKHSGEKITCNVDQDYEINQFLRIEQEGEEGWLDAADVYKGSDVYCEDDRENLLQFLNLVDAQSNAGEYSCAVTAQGKRVHETLHHTPYDCVDRSCGNTCKGGQCVAYVTCNCKRNGKWAPNTGCWRPGRKVQLPNGKCNRALAPNTAIATFPSGGGYYGHAAVFIRCQDDYNVQVYDQGCCRAVGYSVYSSSTRFFKTFATITSPGCSDRPSWPCRVENTGPTCCPVSVPGCKSAKYWWEALNREEISL